MRKLISSKFACGLMIGIGAFVPLGTVSAMGDANLRIQAHLGGEGTSIYTRSELEAQYQQHEAWLSQQGAQGPIRTDMIEDSSVKSDQGTMQQPWNNHLHPLNAAGS
jgi:hypothetical protein